ncbi:MAG: DUF2256 domain-containing protein [Hyphomicrobiaceae bacterium]
MTFGKGSTIAKANLAEKVCATCARPFRWRKKWAKIWNEVRYCSHRCRRGKRVQASAGSGQDQI